MFLYFSANYLNLPSFVHILFLFLSFSIVSSVPSMDDDDDDELMAELRLPPFRLCVASLAAWFFCGENGFLFLAFTHYPNSQTPQIPYNRPNTPKNHISLLVLLDRTVSVCLDV